MRQLTRHFSFSEKSSLLESIKGPRFTLGWFDAVSSQVNDLFTLEELSNLLRYLGFDKILRTMPGEPPLNIVATRIAI